MHKKGRQSGVTLVELLLVLALLSILAAGALVAADPLRQTSFDAAVRQTAQALQFAREEAQRIGMPVVVSIDTGARTLEVQRIDFSTVPESRVAVTHPLQKKPYQLALGKGPFSGGETSIQAVFAFEDGTTSSEIGFNRNGSPGKILSATALSPLTVPGRWRGAWQSGGMSYSKDDWVAHNGVDYTAVQGHSSGTDFQADFDSGRWALRTHPAQIILSSAGLRHSIHVLPVTGFVRSRL